jgi:hypothetical protein
LGSTGWVRLLVICWNISPNNVKNGIDDHQYYLIGDEVLVSCWRCSNRFYVCIVWLNRRS